MSIRRLAELFWRNRRLRRRLPARFGQRPIIVSPDAALRWLRPDESAFEPSLLALADHRITAGMPVWDIGANVGAFTLPAAHRSRAAVLAVEADPFLAGLLRDTAGLPQNRDLDIEVLCVAIGDRDGAARFRIAGRGRASNGLESGTLSTQHGASRQIMTVPTFRLDTLLEDFTAPAFIKVDVEGAELLLLRGATRLLSEIRPTFYIEVSGASRTEACKIFAAAGYQLFDGDSDPTAPDPAGPHCTNLLAIPGPS
jgi:FkbM family methyltransferase